MPKLSKISLIIGLLLTIAFLVITQYLASDIMQTLYGEEPKGPEYKPRAVPIESANEKLESDLIEYDGQTYETYDQAYEIYQSEALNPYRTKSLVVKTALFIPLFLLALYLYQAKGDLTTTMKVATGSLFISMSLNMLVLLFTLIGFIYEINQRIAIYGISALLILVFIKSIDLVQKRQKA